MKKTSIQNALSGLTLVFGLFSTQSVSQAVGPTVASISAGNHHSCAVKSDGSVWCWGSNFNGQIGTDATSCLPKVPTQVSGISGAIAVAAGYSQSCALLSSGKVMCWGANDSGQLGTGTTTTSLTPIAVKGITNAVSISTGNSMTCAALQTGTVSCWGSGDFGGTSPTTHLTPVTIPGITTATSALTVTGYMNCAVIQGGQVMCWGNNYYGSLGNGTVGVQSTSAVLVKGLSNVVQVGGDCAVLSDGEVKCWGIINDPQTIAVNPNLQSATTATSPPQKVHYSLTPVSLAGFGPSAPVSATSVYMGGSDYDSCIVGSDGSVTCFGLQDFNILGTSVAAGTTGRAVIAGIRDATQVAVSSNVGIGFSIPFACALLSSGSVNCWGDDFWGELGDGKTGINATSCSGSFSTFKSPTVLVEPIGL